MRIEEGSVSVVETQKYYEDSNIVSSTRAQGFVQMIEGVASRVSIHDTDQLLMTQTDLSPKATKHGVSDK